ncbi:MAG: fibronectin/fibrinogen-binding protein [Ruminococcaceae bacterium]|nr:fibronectin/fibrinogen-binding protein [Oscillospiraceae bacterium]
MAFDAGMLAAAVHEIRSLGGGGRIEKVMQPERDEIVLQMRTLTGGRRLLIDAGSNPRIGFSSLTKENPPQAPMFCMLLRKHLTGATLACVEQEGFERVVTLGFDCRDEMGFACKKYIIAEIMGKYSNLIFADENKKIISALKIVDFSTSSQRQVLPGMRYELPPSQNKLDPREVDGEAFARLYNAEPHERPCEKFITSAFCGISSAVAREIVFLATRHTDTPMRYCNPELLYRHFSCVMDRIRNNDYAPTAVLDGQRPVEYAFCPLTQYAGLEVKHFDSVGELLDAYFEGRDRDARIKQRAADLLRILSHAEARISKKIQLQHAELDECEQAGVYKKYGDMITANLYALSRGMSRAEIVDYEAWDEASGEYGKCVIELDTRLSPPANAQKYYKKYAKARNAKVELARQIEIGERELEYIYTVFDALSHAENSADLAQIREELYHSGYASRMKGYAAPKKQPTPTVMEFTTSGGYRVLCGKNNVQNEYITHKIGQKQDYWFHAKNVAGSHVLLITNGEEPAEIDFTEAAMIAAQYSKAAGGALVAVDYLFVKNIKRVPGAKPGFVTYHTNWTAYVTPDAERVAAMRTK